MGYHPPAEIGTNLIVTHLAYRGLTIQTIRIQLMIKKMMFIETLLKYDFILIANLTYHLDQSQYENLMNSQNLMKKI